jgi:hypothetical protein
VRRETVSKFKYRVEMEVECDDGQTYVHTTNHTTYERAEARRQADVKWFARDYTDRKVVSSRVVEVK